MANPMAESADKYSTRILVRRLLVDEALRHWPLYAFAFVLMAIAAAATALTAYLLGTMINETYVNKQFPHGRGHRPGRDGDLHGKGICDLRLGRHAVADRQPHHRR